MKEIKITPPEGYEIDMEASTFDCIKFKPVEKKNLTWEEIQEKNVGKTQYFLSAIGGIKHCKLNRNIKENISNVPTERIAEKIRALCQLYIIAEYYNEGWVPGYDKTKYYPIWSDEKKCIDYDFYISFSAPFPAFKSAETLKAAYEANREIFETALKP